MQENAFENVVWKMASILSRPECVKQTLSTCVSKVEFSSIQTPKTVMDLEKSIACPVIETLKSETYLFPFDNIP